VLFEPILRFLSTNKECKRMFRRQQHQFDAFNPAFQCFLLGLLSSAGVSDISLELFPHEDVVSLSVQLKETMNALYTQYQDEYFSIESDSTALVPSSVPASTVANVQARLIPRRVY
jgi:hypothetical protein